MLCHNYRFWDLIVCIFFRKYRRDCFLFPINCELMILSLKVSTFGFRCVVNKEQINFDLEKIHGFDLFGAGFVS